MGALISIHRNTKNPIWPTQIFIQILEIQVVDKSGQIESTNTWQTIKDHLFDGRVSKIYPPSKQVLKDIYLSFLLWGRKIEFSDWMGRENPPYEDYRRTRKKSLPGRVVFLRDIQLDTFLKSQSWIRIRQPGEVVMEGAQKVVDLLKEFEEINNKFAEPMDDDAMNKLIARQVLFRMRLTRPAVWEIDNKIEIAMDALRCPDPESSVANLSEVKNEESLCVVCCCRSRMFCCWMSQRITSMLNLCCG